jgi:NAD(P)-dependent dehydrogenase (short-subunit alcohol dehydrogenase family)
MLLKRSIASLHGKTALITGGSKGIGLEIAKELSNKGASIILLARSKDLLKHNIEHELSTIDNAQQHSYIQCDLNQTSSISEVIQSSSSVDLKRVSILINSAGVSQNSLLYSTSQINISRLIDTNLTSSIILSQLLLKSLITNKPSSIINISSVLGLRGVKGTSVYSAAKAGLIGFTKALAQELGPKNIRINSISPGLVQETDMGKGLTYDNALQRDSVDIEDIIKTVVFLLENESITGQNIVVDNGFLC